MYSFLFHIRVHIHICRTLESDSFYHLRIVKGPWEIYICTCNYVISKESCEIYVLSFLHMSKTASVVLIGILMFVSFDGHGQSLLYVLYSDWNLERSLVHLYPVLTLRESGYCPSGPFSIRKSVNEMPKHCLNVWANWQMPWYAFVLLFCAWA